MRLRLDEVKGVLKVTHPRGVQPAAALAWAASHKEWVERQLSEALPAEPFVAGGVIPIEGREVELCWSEQWARVPRLAHGKLLCGGPPGGFSRRVEQFLRQRALDVLSRETAAIAGKAGLRAVSVSIGDARTRWGSCSSSGKIRYSWRLILADPIVRRYVVAHEVAHLAHLNHGTAFKALERELYGGETAAAEALLRRSAPRLRLVGVAR